MSIAVAENDIIWVAINADEFEALKTKADPYFRNMYGDDFILKEAGWQYPTNWADYNKPQQKALIDEYLATNKTYYSWIFDGWIPLESDPTRLIASYWRVWSLERRAIESLAKLGAEVQPNIMTNITAELLADCEKTVAKISTKSFKISFDKAQVTEQP